MEITEPLLKERFRALNQEIFDGQLRMPTKMSVRKMTLAAGQANYNKKRMRTTITISSCFDFTPATLDEVMIHEMIHLAHALQGHRMSHGWRFKAECRRIYKEHGIVIRVRAKHIPLKEQYKNIKIPLYEKVIYYLLTRCGSSTAYCKASHRPPCRWHLSHCALNIPNNPPPNLHCFCRRTTTRLQIRHPREFLQMTNIQSLTI